MRKKFSYIILGIFFSFVLSLILDKIVGTILENNGYFKAIAPDRTEIYDTNEFTITAKISSQGLRNGEVNIPKPKDTFRILALGDSFTYGWGVKETESWPKLLEVKLNEINPMNKKIEVINAGIPGGDPIDENLVCKAYRNYLQVDMVILALTANDFFQESNNSTYNNKFHKTVQNIWPSLSRIKNPIVSYLWWTDQPKGTSINFSEIWKQVIEESLKNNPTILLNVDPRLRNDFLNGKISPALIREAKDNITFSNYLNDKKKKNDDFQKKLKVLKNDCFQNLPTQIIFLPANYLVSDFYIPFRSQLGYKIDKTLTSVDADKDIQKIIEKQNIPYISLLSEFRKDGCKDCFYPYDMHFTAKGHERMVNFMTPIISKNIESIKK